MHHTRDVWELGLGVCPWARIYRCPWCQPFMLILHVAVEKNDYSADKRQTNNAAHDYAANCASTDRFLTRASGHLGGSGRSR